MGIQRWIIILTYDYGHHAVYVGAHNLTLFQKVFTLPSVRFFTDKVLIHPAYRPSLAFNRSIF